MVNYASKGELKRGRLFGAVRQSEYLERIKLASKKWKGI